MMAGPRFLSHRKIMDFFIVFEHVQSELLVAKEVRTMVFCEKLWEVCV